jgi:hypothetical protein
VADLFGSGDEGTVASVVSEEPVGVESFAEGIFGPAGGYIFEFVLFASGWWDGDAFDFGSCSSSPVGVIFEARFAPAYVGVLVADGVGQARDVHF